MVRSLAYLPLVLIVFAGCDPAAGGGVDCTEIGCSSTLTLTFEHDLPLDEPVLFRVTTPDHVIRCSIGAEPSGVDTCFGFAFSDLSWDEGTVTLVLTDPFLATDENPDSSPYESVEAELTLDGAVLAATTVTIDGGEPDTPNGPDCPPTCWQATGSGDLR